MRYQWNSKPAFQSPAPPLRGSQNPLGFWWGVRPRHLLQRIRTLHGSTPHQNREERFWLPLKGGAGFCLIVLALTVASCGVQRPLMRPKDIPAYEEQQRKKREEIEQEQRQLEAIDAKRGAVVTPITEPVN
jgi:hypothetical protein